MYQLRRPTNRQLLDYYAAYGPTIRALMHQLKDGTQIIPITLGRGRTSIKLTLRVQRNSATWQFLDRYSQELHLRRLLCGDWNEQLDIIREVCQSFPNLSWQKRMTKENFLAGKYATYGMSPTGQIVVEDFNEILHWLFVEQIYDGGYKGVHLDKTAFVRERGMLVCPYCGRQFIDMAEVEGSVSKPYIDHFLPKSKYPFLAMTYMNLIPGCNTCNEASNKGTLDPLTHPAFDSLLLNPHVFRNTAVTFGYKYNFMGENNARNFNIWTIAENTFLEEGYLTRLKLGEFYSHQQLEVKDLYRNFTKASNAMKKFLMRLGLKDYFLNNIEQCTLGFNLNDGEASRRIMYKFKHDLFMQLRQEYGI